MKGTCALFKEDSKLIRSHIIPKFAFEYLKNTGVKYLRSFDIPNKRVQDGAKIYLLSNAAEQEFSRRERWFANNVFYPYLNEGQQYFNYDGNLAYFVISVLWRVLKYNEKNPEISSRSKFEFLKEVQEEWRLYLAKNKCPKKYKNLNIFLTDHIDNHNTNAINADLYLSRAIDSTLISDTKGNTIGVYAKFSRFIIWSILQGKPTKGKRIKVKIEKGKLKLPQSISDQYFGGFLHHRIIKFDNRPMPNLKEQEKIRKEIAKNEKAYWRSDSGRALLNDWRIKTNANR